MESVVCRAALAEQQPVALVTGVDARFQQRPQSGQAGPVADQQQGAIVGGDAEAGIGAHAQVHHAAGFNAVDQPAAAEARSEEHTSELQSLMRISYAVFCLKKKKSKK